MIKVKAGDTLKVPEHERGLLMGLDMAFYGAMVNYVSEHREEFGAVSMGGDNAIISCVSKFLADFAIGCALNQGVVLEEIKKNILQAVSQYMDEAYRYRVGSANDE